MRESAFGVGDVNVHMCKVPQRERVNRMLHPKPGKCLHDISRPRQLPAILVSGENEGELQTPPMAATAERHLPACSPQLCLSPDYKSCRLGPGRALSQSPMRGSWWNLGLVVGPSPGGGVHIQVTVLSAFPIFPPVHMGWLRGSQAQRQS